MMPTISNARLIELAEELKQELSANQICVSPKANNIQERIRDEFFVRYSGFGAPWEVYKNDWHKVSIGELTLPDFIEKHKDKLAGEISGDPSMTRNIKWQCYSCGRSDMVEVNNNITPDVWARAKRALEEHRASMHPEDLVEN